jgi:glycine/D-amino acid oxidase-like deaminating enzyme
MPSKQYIIIGSGVSGTSTTLHLLDAVEENSTVLTIISRHQSLEPSDDISKIVRIDYATVSRMKEAICAQQHWQNNNRFKPFYQPVGRVVAYDESNLPTLDGIDSTRSQLGLQNRPRSDKAVLEKFYGKIETRTNLTFVWNEDDGLVDWRSCMQALTTEIEEHCEKNKGSSLREVFAQKLVHEENQISAICLDGGEEIDAIDAQVIVAAGPWIAELLERSGIEQPPISRTPVATGVFTFTLQLNEVQAKFFMGKPAFSHIGYGLYVDHMRSNTGLNC